MASRASVLIFVKQALAPFERVSGIGIAFIMPAGSDHREQCPPRAWLAVAAVAVLSVACFGCGASGPARIMPPRIDPVVAGKAAIAEYDSDGDGILSGHELDRCPALKSAAKHYADATGQITADSIAEAIARWQANRIAITIMGVVVTLDGKPLDGATVIAEPEKFLGPEVQTASGVTDVHGGCAMRVQGQLGMQYGLYKIRITKSVGGKESIPARYNTATQLGLEVAPAGGLTTTGVTFNLRSR